MTIADFSLPRSISRPSEGPKTSPRDAGGSTTGGPQSSPVPTRGEVPAFRPMRWLVPWLWQLSQSPVDDGEAIDWEIDLPEGDRLRLHGVRHYGEWILDFAGSSGRLQRWIGQHAEELAGRLQRIIGKPVRLHLDPQSPLQSAS